ncbi:OmpA family protein [Aliiruegeria haliotis]|uniref:OmpA family protein n=1 Tax=Aliiruegeria haliotis TaxID=1280846 RepID=A0A2T0RVW5_9RHOB|nr:OmpA family protein [Aliiruegeria haliotis]PRY25335.1 OmpA family protein [Aliiruegeria haliotis]
MRIPAFLLVALLSLLPLQLHAQTVGTINFDFDSATLDAEALAKVATIAEQLKTNPSYKPTVVVGHTDAVGSYGYNQSLGLRRAQAVANALVAAGAPVARVGTVESRGKNELLVAVSGPERRNRRVTVTLEDMLAACRSWRDIGLDASAVGEALQNDLNTRLGEAVSFYQQLASSGGNGPAFQMAGAAREDCGNAVGFDGGSVRKVEYAQRCMCSSARMRVAAGIN